MYSQQQMQHEFIHNCQLEHQKAIEELKKVSLKWIASNFQFLKWPEVTADHFFRKCNLKQKKKLKMQKESNGVQTVGKKRI